MAYEITLSGAPDQEKPETFFLCSTGAWTKFSEWVIALPEEYLFLRRLVGRGRVLGTDRLAKEILDAAAITPPTDLGVAATLRQLGDVVGEAGDPDETAALDSGEGSEESERSERNGASPTANVSRSPEEMKASADAFGATNKVNETLYANYSPPLKDTESGSHIYKAGLHSSRAYRARTPESALRSHERAERAHLRGADYHVEMARDMTRQAKDKESEIHELLEPHQIDEHVAHHRFVAKLHNDAAVKHQQAAAIYRESVEKRHLHGVHLSDEMEEGHLRYPHMTDEEIQRELGY